MSHRSVSVAASEENVFVVSTGGTMAGVYVQQLQAYRNSGLDC